MVCRDDTHILIVDDDPEIRDLLAHYLEQENFRVDAVSNGEGIDRLLSAHRFHLVLLDLMMPGEDGLSICRRIRANSAIPIIILTAKGEEMDRIIGLEMGADDYIPKPFNPRELVARIKAVLWRTTHTYGGPGQEAANDRLEFGDWVASRSERTVMTRSGEILDLSSGEFDLLLAFASNPQRTLTRDQLLDLTQGRALDPYDRSIDIQVSRLRRKIEKDPHEPRVIKTVRGVGYTFTLAVKQG
jgi:two-component system OmpR family response regulator